MPQKNYLRIDQINGESQIRGHENEIEVLSWNWTVTIKSGPVTSGGGTAGRPNVTGVTFSHFVDLASTKLLRNCLGGTHIPRAVLSVHSDPNATFDYFKLTLEEVIITSVIISSPDSSTRTIETVTMEFARITEEYVKATSSGAAGTRLSTSFDVRTLQVTGYCLSDKGSLTKRFITKLVIGVAKLKRTNSAMQNKKSLYR